MLRIILSSCAIILVLSASAFARKLKAYSYPKEVAAGQMAMIVFENPNTTQVISRTKCDAEKLIAWVKQDVPILRIEQKGRAVFTSLGSYQSMGDSIVASWMVPVNLEAGEATIFILNDRDASIPYSFIVTAKPVCSLQKVVSGSIKALQPFSVVGTGFEPSEQLDTKVAIHALEMNLGYSKLPAAEQYTVLNKRMAIDWAQITRGDFLAVDQGTKHWDIFVESCGITQDGLTLDFICPPDLTTGDATLTLTTRTNGAERCKSLPLKVSVQ